MFNNIILRNYYYRITINVDQVFENWSDIKTEGESSFDYDYSSNDELDNDVLQVVVFRRMF